MQEYLNWKRTYTKPRTALNYSRFVKLFCFIINGKEPTIDHIIRYHSALSLKYSEKTIAYGMAVLRDFVGFYSPKKGWAITKDDVQIPRARSHPHLPIDEVEYVTLLTWMRPTDIKKLRDNVIIRMLWDTGCRISELVNIQNFDTENKMALIDNAKRDDEGYLFWGKMTNEFLKSYLDQNPSPVFPCQRQIERILQFYCHKAGIEKHIVCHSFRHSKAWRILDDGGSVKDVQAILRHKSPLSSFKYLEWNHAKKRERAGKFLDKETVTC